MTSLFCHIQFKIPLLAGMLATNVCHSSAAHFCALHIQIRFHFEKLMRSKHILENFCLELLIVSAFCVTDEMNRVINSNLARFQSAETREKLKILKE